jgi:hypothetical protein
MSGLEEANRKFQETQEEFLRMSRDLQESKARLEEAQRVAHVGYWIWNLEKHPHVRRLQKPVKSNSYMRSGTMKTVMPTAFRTWRAGCA